MDTEWTQILSLLFKQNKGDFLLFFSNVDVVLTPVIA